MTIPSLSTQYYVGYNRLGDKLVVAKRATTCYIWNGSDKHTVPYVGDSDTPTLLNKVEEVSQKTFAEYLEEHYKKICEK